MLTVTFELALVDVSICVKPCANTYFVIILLHLALTFILLPILPVNLYHSFWNSFLVLHQAPYCVINFFAIDFSSCTKKSAIFKHALKDEQLRNQNAKAMRFAFVVYFTFEHSLDKRE